MAKRSFSHFVEQEVGRFPHFVLYAVLEWILIALLFVDGFLAFTANGFAKLFGLQMPCLFCTRIDHVFVHRDRNFYFNDSVCESHKKEVSSLAFCHNHKKISDIRRMCESCLLSFATEKESDCDTYKSLVGILQKDLECFVDYDHDHGGFPAAKTVQEDRSEGVRCSCCGEALKKTTSATKKALGGNNPKGGRHNLLFSQAQAPTPSPRAPFSRHRSNGELKLMAENESDVAEFESGSSQEKLREDVKAAMAPLLAEADDLNDELANKTPSFVKGNRFFGIPLTDSASNSPRLGMRISRKSPLERTELASESMEGNANPTTNDSDVDSILHGLKKQVRLDRKSLMALYMELDEERSASAVAANNAMAMITRLQAEKAAVQMEALQYQRMMEEQFEYDQEALQDTNELLIKREEEIKALETELEAYREKYGCFKGEDGADNDDQPKTLSYYSDSGRTEIGSSPVSFDDREANGEFGHDFDESVSSPVGNGCENGIDNEIETSLP